MRATGVKFDSLPRASMILVMWSDTQGSAAIASYALLWTSTNGTILFGDSWPVTGANGVSNVGQIVGQDATNELFTFGLGHATSWKSGVATDLGTLGGGADVVEFSSSANGVNDLGQVVGWSDTAPYFSDAPIHAVLWGKNGNILDLGTLAGDTLSAASNINFFGQVIGSSGNRLGFQGMRSQSLAVLSSGQRAME